MAGFSRERLLAGIGIVAGVLGGEAAEDAGLGAWRVWLILTFTIPILLGTAGARAIKTFVLAGIALAATLQAHQIVFNIRSRYYEAYGIRSTDIAGVAMFWGWTVGIAAAVGLVAKHFSSRKSSSGSRR